MNMPLGSAWPRALIAIALLVLIPIGLAISAPPGTGAAGVGTSSKFIDADLYREVMAALSPGQGYYDAVAVSHRAHDYPLHPFVVVRLPTLALIWAYLGNQWMKLISLALVAATLWAWQRQWSIESKSVRIAAILLAASGMTFIADPDSLILHETWGGLLVALAIGCYNRDRPLAVVLLLLAASLIRETAVPALLLVASWYGWHKQWRGAVMGAASIAVFAVIMVGHKHMVDTIPPLPTDMTSNGWSAAGGWPSYLSFVSQTTILRFFPAWASAVLVPLALLGWFASRSEAARIMGCFQVGMAIFFMMFGRADNFYWGFLVAPMLMAGLAFFPRLILSFKPNSATTAIAYATRSGKSDQA